MWRDKRVLCTRCLSAFAPLGGQRLWGCFCRPESWSCFPFTATLSRSVDAGHEMSPLHKVRLLRLDNIKVMLSANGRDSGSVWSVRSQRWLMAEAPAAGR